MWRWRAPAFWVRALWDHRSNTLFWVDIKNPGIWRYHPEAKEHFRIDAPERVGFIALTPDQDVVVAGFKSGLGASISERRDEPIVSPDKDKPNNRINDGHVGPDGAIYFGTMDDEEKKAPVPSGAGTARS